MPTRRHVLGSILGAALAAPGHLLAAPGRPALKVGVLPFGTVSWEVETIRALGLDAANGFALEPVRLAGNEAARIAFQGGAVDTIVTDLLLAARLRAEGRRLRFLPFSATEGAVMVPAASGIRRVADLKGARLGVAGGPLDKSWLLLRAHATDAAGLDLVAASQPAFGAPPLLAQKLEAGELDAALLYWNFCARLEAKGFRRLVGAGDLARALGATGEIALLGYAFDEALSERAPGLIEGFAAASRAAKDRLAADPSAWMRLRPLMAAEDEATFEALRRAYLDGIPRRPVAEERADAERLYAVLARLGGERLVGAARSLPTGLYWREGAA